MIFKDSIYYEQPFRKLYLWEKTPRSSVPLAVPMGIQPNQQITRRSAPLRNAVPLYVPMIIRPNQQVAQQLCGFIWADNSCAFDSVATPLFYLFHNLPYVHKELFLEVFVKIREAFDDFDLHYDEYARGDQQTWNRMKPYVLNFARVSPYMDSVVAPTQAPNAMTTPGQIWSSFLSHHADTSNECFYIIKRDEPNCCSLEAVDQGQNHANTFGPKCEGILVLGANLPQSSDIQFENIGDLFDEYFTMEFKLYGRECPHCHTKDVVIHSVFVQTPIILFVQIEDGGRHIRSNHIDREMRFLKDRYYLFAAIYGNDGHFKTRFCESFENGCNVLEYDGVLHTGKMAGGIKSIIVRDAVKFPCHLQSGGYVMTNLIYVNHTKISLAV
jgi:hypothetical protein